jgi:hypothetical protein
VKLLAAALLLLGPPPFAHFSGSGISFDYPAAWRAQTWNVSTTRSKLVTYLSSQRLHDPCVRTPEVIRCGLPLDRLRGGGVFVAVTRYGNPSFDLARVAGRPRTIGGHPARIDARTHACDGIGAHIALAVTIATGSSDYTIVVACMRAPYLIANRALFDLLLGTVQFER